ncbi:MAG: cyanophycinase [Planctomycetota bacterium]|nr:cyanophycinase [Planctomycetota bacterium]
MQFDRLVCWFAAILIQGIPGTAMAQFDPVGQEPLPPIEGTLFLHGGGIVNAEMRSLFVSLAGGKEARIVVIPTADQSNPLDPKEIDLWLEHNPRSVETLHAESRDLVDEANAEKRIANATGVWFGGGKQSRLIDVYSGTNVEQEILKLLTRGGVVGGTSAGAAIASKVMLVQEGFREGFDLLPGTVIDQQFDARSRSERLRRIVDKHPDRVGFGIDERTALIVRGRQLFVVGESSVHVALAASTERPVRTDVLKSGQRADLLAFRRAAQARQASIFPSKQVITPKVANGTLLIAGGGNLPDEALEAFVELAGGKEARILYVPCEEAKVIEQEPGMVRLFRRAGAGHADWFHTKDRKVADDPSFTAKLDGATGIWFGGGRQWNLVDSYLDTETHRLMHAVLERGGVVGGSSAGASIQGDYMPRGDPMGNTQMMAEGYERGLGFLTGVAIDQHFSQRNRFGDMALLKRTFPQLLGIGIDEGTCLIVKQSKAEVIGPGQVAFYDRPSGSESLEANTSVTQGAVYDMESRTLLAK